MERETRNKKQATSSFVSNEFSISSRREREVDEEGELGRARRRSRVVHLSFIQPPGHSREHVHLRCIGQTFSLRLPLAIQDLFHVAFHRTILLDRFFHQLLSGYRIHVSCHFWILLGMNYRSAMKTFLQQRNERRKRETRRKDREK